MSKNVDFSTSYDRRTESSARLAADVEAGRALDALDEAELTSWTRAVMRKDAVIDSNRTPAVKKAVVEEFSRLYAEALCETPPARSFENADLFSGLRGDLQQLRRYIGKAIDDAPLAQEAMADRASTLFIEALRQAVPPAAPGTPELLSGLGRAFAEQALQQQVRKILCGMFDPAAGDLRKTSENVFDKAEQSLGGLGKKFTGFLKKKGL